jgi:hypothetical protein
MPVLCGMSQDRRRQFASSASVIELVLVVLAFKVE